MANYTEAEIADITEREQKGLEALKALNLTPAAQISKVQMGNDIFADKLIPFLQDTKYTSTPSPVQVEAKTDEPLEETK